MHLAAHGSDRLQIRASIVELLLAKGVEVDPRASTGCTLLHLASGTGVVDVAEALVRGAADLNAVDRNGKNALDTCIKSSRTMAKCPPHFLPLFAASAAAQHSILHVQ